MSKVKDYKPMAYAKDRKLVDGFTCPKKYGGYDQTTYDCIHCGEAKLYKTCGYYGDRMACNGWINEEYGPVSCKGFVQTIEDRSNFL